MHAYITINHLRPAKDKLPVYVPEFVCILVFIFCKSGGINIFINEESYSRGVGKEKQTLYF